MDRWKRELKRRWSGRIFHRRKDNGSRQKEHPLKLLYSEHTLDAEQLADLFPLARIDAHNVLGSRGISHDEARLRLADQCRQRRTRRASSALRSLRSCLCSTFPLLLFTSVLICLLIALLDPPYRQTVLPMALLQALILAVIGIIGAIERCRIRRLGSTFQKAAINGNQNLHFVVREGTEAVVREKEILVGDLLWVEAGQRVPADLRILYVDNEFRADTSWLTRRSQPLEFTACPAPRHSDLLRTRNVLFSEFVCTQGRALGLVIRTCKNTLYTRLLSLNHTSSPCSSSAAENGVPREDALPRAYRRLVRSVVWASLTLSTFALFLSFLLTDFAHPFRSFVHVFLVILIASIPQALPLTLSAQLLLMAKRLRRKCGGIFLRQADKADALGRTSILMIHSSSVLTTNRPSVSDIWLPGQNSTIISTVKLAEGEKDELEQQTAEELFRTAAFCCGMNRQRRNTSEKNHRRNAKIPHSFADVQIGDHSLKRAPLNRVTSYLSHTVDLSSAESDTTANKMEHQQNPTDVAITRFLHHLTMQNVFRRRNHSIRLPKQKDEDEEELCIEHILPDRHRLPSNVEVEVISSKWEEEAEGRTEGKKKLEPKGKRRKRYRLAMKGAAEEVIGMCSMIRGGGEPEVGEDGDGRRSGHPPQSTMSIDEHHLAQFEDAFVVLSGQAKCCVGFAVLDLSQDDNGDDPSSVVALTASSASSSLPPSYAEEWDEQRTPTPSSTISDFAGGWCFLGMLALEDPPREGCRAQLGELSKAGVQLVVLSDKHPLAAEALSEQLGLFESGKEEKPDKISVIQMPLELRLDGAAASFGAKTHRKTSIGSSSGYHSSEKGDNNKQNRGEHQHRVEVTKNDDSNQQQQDKKLFVQMMASKGRHCVFSQLGFHQILEFIKECQSRGHSITFVGDDPLKDVSLLQTADVGIARNGGSILLKEAADVLCANVHLENLVYAIGESRLVLENLASTLAFSLSHTVPALFPVLLTLLFTLPPFVGLISPMQTLAVTLIAQIPPAVALVFSRPSRGSIHRKIRNRRSLAPLGLMIYAYLFAGSLLTVGSLLAYFSIFWNNGINIFEDLIAKSDEFILLQENDAKNLTIVSTPSGLQPLPAVVGQARSAWLLTLVGAQLVHVWICAGFMRRTFIDSKIFRNWPLWLAVLFDLTLLCLFIYSPGFHSALGLVPPPPWIWLFPVGTALGLLVLNAFTALAVQFVRGKAGGKETNASQVTSLLFEW